MKLSGGNYGGYAVVTDEVLLYDENNFAIDTQAITMDGDNLVVNGWVYNEEGIFIGME